MHRISVICLSLLAGAALTGCLASTSGGPYSGGKVEVDGPWQPYESQWEGEAKDLPLPPGGHAAQFGQAPQSAAPAAMPAPGAAAVASPPADAGLPTYGIPELQQPARPRQQAPSAADVARTQFPDPQAAPSDATYVNVQP